MNVWKLESLAIISADCLTVGNTEDSQDADVDQILNKYLLSYNRNDSQEEI
jgi:hypothetical protein